MSIYVLDGSFNRIGLVDSYKSFIWTERYDEAGDFELVLKSSSSALNLFLLGRMIMKSGSKRVMLIQQIVESVIDGVPSITVKGDSLEGILKARGMVYGYSAYVDGGPSLDKPTETFRQAIFRAVTGLGIFPAYAPDRIAGSYPYVQDGLEESLPYVAQPYGECRPGYEVIKDYLDPHQIGFKAIWTPDDRMDSRYPLEWWCYRGIDRPEVLFSPALGNFVDVETLSTNENYYDMVQYFGGKGALYGARVAATEYMSGTFHRSKALRDTSVVPDEELTQNGALTILYQKALAEFGKGRRDRIISGEVIETNGYTYDVDYSLGDRVTVLDSRNQTNTLLVSEYVYVHDDTGEYGYPALSQVSVADTAQAFSTFSSNSTPHYAIPAE